MKNSKKKTLMYSRNKKILIFLIIVLASINILFMSGLLLLKPQTQGEKNFSYAEDLKNINNKDLSFQEITDYFTALAKKKGAAYAYDVLKKAELPPNTDFHLLAHAVGDVLFTQMGADGIKICTDDFRNACSHSIVISLFRQDGLNAIIDIARVCKEAPGGKGAYTMCFHGLGHGVLAYTAYNMEEAINLCERVGTEAYQQREYIECVGGITMEMAQGVHDIDQWESQFPNYFTATDPLSPCNRDFMPDLVKSQCYMYLTPHLFNTAGANGERPTPEQIDLAFTYCDRIPTNQIRNRHECFGGFGKEFIVLVQDRDIRKMELLTSEQLETVNNWCMLADTEQAVSSCITQAVNSLYWGGENSWQTPVNLCHITHDVYKASCFRNMIANIEAYNDASDYRNTFCKAIPTQYYNQCKKQLLAG